MSYAAAFARTAKRQAKVMLAGGLIASGHVSRARTQRGSSLAVLMYHGVLADVRGPAAYGDLFVSAADFAKQLRHLKTHYQPMTIEQIADAIESDAPFPPRAVAVTFDDGYENNVKVAMPLLADAGIPATVFVPSDLVGGRRYLWFDCLRLLVMHAWDRRHTIGLGSGIDVRGVAPGLQEDHFLTLSSRILDLPVTPRNDVLAAIEQTADRDGLVGRSEEFQLTTWRALKSAVSGGLLSVGSHTRAHGDLSTMTLAEQTADLRASREQIERELSRPCTVVAYPYGRWNPDTLSAAKDAGYRCGLTVENGFNTSRDQPLQLKRIMVGDKGNVPLLCARLSGSWDRLRIHQ